LLRLKKENGKKPGFGEKKLLLVRWHIGKATAGKSSQTSILSEFQKKTETPEEASPVSDRGPKKHQKTLAGRDQRLTTNTQDLRSIIALGSIGGGRRGG